MNLLIRTGVLLALLVACGSETPAPTTCTVGRVKPCPCPNGTGAQSCQRDGTYSACVCPDASVPMDVSAADAPTADALDAMPAQDTTPEAAAPDARGDVVSSRAAYEKCMSRDACAAGTMCIQSSVQVPNTAQGSHCSTLCPTGAANTCPGYVAGQVECIALNGNVAQAQCFRLCQSTNDCALFNTTCTQITLPAGPIRVCAPSEQCLSDAQCASMPTTPVCLRGVCRPRTFQCQFSYQCGRLECRDGCCTTSRDDVCEMPQSTCRDDTQCNAGSICYNGACRRTCPTPGMGSDGGCMQLDVQFNLCRMDGMGRSLCTSTNEQMPQCARNTDCMAGRVCVDARCQ